MIFITNICLWAMAIMNDHKHQSKGQSKHSNCLFMIVTVCAIILDLASWLDILNPVVARQRQLKYSKEVYLFILSRRTSFYSKLNSTIDELPYEWFLSRPHINCGAWVSKSTIIIFVIQKMRAVIMKKLF